MNLRACLKTTSGPVFAPRAAWRGASASALAPENTPCGSSTEEQRSQAALGAKTLRAAGLLPVACVGSFLTARCGDARNSPPWPQPKSPAARPLVVFKQALSRLNGEQVARPSGRITISFSKVCSNAPNRSSALRWFWARFQQAGKPLKRLRASSGSRVPLLKQGVNER